MNWRYFLRYSKQTWQRVFWKKLFSKPAKNSSSTSTISNRVAAFFLYLKTLYLVRNQVYVRRTVSCGPVQDSKSVGFREFSLVIRRDCVLNKTTFCQTTKTWNWECLFYESFTRVHESQINHEILILSLVDSENSTMIQTVVKKCHQANPEKIDHV